MSGEAELSEQLLDIGFCPYNGRFAGNQPANNKLTLDYDRLAKHPDILGAVVERMCNIVETFEPEFIAGVPDGATGLAGAVARELNDRKIATSEDGEIHHVFLRKNPDTKVMDYEREIDRMTAMCLEHGVLVEDVFTRGTSTQRALAMAGLGPRITAVVPIFDRGLIEERKPITQPIHSVVGRHIPPTIDKTSSLWPRLLAAS